MASQYPGAPHGHPPPSTYPGAPGGANGSAGVAPIPDSYFVESKKGEINELRTLLRGFSTERDPNRKRDIIKKVIAYMTLGIDVSRLFTEMMLAIETRDLVIKKMVYLYLTNYARTHPELAQMCTNTLQKDCNNEDPMVRGLALRALCGLNLPQMVEYISEPLRRSLQDGHAYVRKTAIMGVLKLFHLDKEAFENTGFVDLLYDMLRDPDASVVVNCVIVLNEVMQHSPAGGMAINRAIMLHLLNRIHEFNEFAKVQILELVPRYIPANEEEGYQIMNLLDPVLRTSGSAAVMATIRAFMSIADFLGEDGGDTMKRQIVDRVKAPLVTQISSGSSEMMHTLLKHVHALAELCPGIFDDEYRQFYVRYNEPSHVKYVKIAILPKLSNPDTAPDIVSELAEHVYNKNIKLARMAIQSMGQVACSGKGGPGAAEAIARRLVDMLDLNVDHISSEAANVLTLMVRKHAALKTLIAPPLVRSLKYTTDNSGKASIICLIGECGEMIQEAPYALEKLIDNYQEITDADVKTALLTATVKLFFMRPPETQRMLGRLLSKATEDVSCQDLHDRALFYYRMLRSGTDVTTLERVIRVNTNVPDGIPFSEENDEELRAELMEEFNTLSILYGKPSVNFIAPEFQVKYTKMPEEHPLDGGTHVSFEVPSVAAAPTGGVNHVTTAQVPTSAPPPVQALADEFDLLGFGSSPAPAAPAAPAIEFSLTPNFAMSGEDYQNRWGAIADKDASVLTIPLSSLPANTDQFEQALDRVGVMTMASGELPGEFKFFLYAQEASMTGTLYMIQANVEKTVDPLMIVTVKCDDGTNVEKLIELMARTLNG